MYTKSQEEGYILTLGSLLISDEVYFFLKIGQAGGKCGTLCFSFIFSRKRRLRPLGYSAPMKDNFLPSCNFFLKNPKCKRYLWDQCRHLKADGISLPKEEGLEEALHCPILISNSRIMKFPLRTGSE